MREDVLSVIKLLIENDRSVPEEQRLRILAACRTKPATARRRLGTVKQAAEILGCCTRSVERYAKQGCFLSIHHSARKVRYDLDEVQGFANQGVDKQEG